MMQELQKQLNKNKRLAKGQVFIITDPVSHQYKFVEPGELIVNGITLNQLFNRVVDLEKENKKLKRKVSFLTKATKLLGGNK